MSKTRLIIVEGCDRVGKDTLIKGLQKSLAKTRTIHWGYPVGETNEDKTEYQKADFQFQMKNWHIEKANADTCVVIWNRSHIGEYVYGKMYRDSYPETWVTQMEESFLSMDSQVYLILLIADPEFIAKQDDGLSYSASTTDKREELHRFLKSFEHSKISNKKLIMVHDKNGYHPPIDILEQVIKFIN